MLTDMLFEVKASDPAVLAGVVGVMLLAAAIASVVPARRVLRQTPAQSLRDI